MANIIITIIIVLLIACAYIKKLGAYVVMVLIILSIFAVFMPGIYRSVGRAKRLEEEKLELNAKKQSGREYILNLEERLEELDNKFYLEKSAREVLKMKKPGETIYRVAN